MSCDAIGKCKRLLREEPVRAVVGDHALAQIGEDPGGQRQERVNDKSHLECRPRVSGPVDDRAEDRKADHEECGRRLRASGVMYATETAMRKNKAR